MFNNYTKTFNKIFLFFETKHKNRKFRPRFLASMHNPDLVNHEHEPRKINLPHCDLKYKALLSSFLFKGAYWVEKLGQEDWGGVLLRAIAIFGIRPKSVSN